MAEKPAFPLYRRNLVTTPPPRAVTAQYQCQATTISCWLCKSFHRDQARRLFVPASHAPVSLFSKRKTPPGRIYTRKGVFLSRSWPSSG